MTDAFLAVDEEETPPTVEEQQELEYFTKTERCDQCYVAQAFYRVEFEAGFLFLCRHHFM
jgi:ribosomal protein S14